MASKVAAQNSELTNPRLENFRGLNLRDTLLKLGYYDSAQDRLKRDEIMKEMNNHFKQWLLDISPNHLKSSINAIEKFVYPFGSYALGFIEKDSNMDLICIAPKNISIKEYFQSFSLKLQKLSHVTGLLRIPRAYTPLLQLTYRDIQMNSIFVNVDIEHISNVEFLQDVTIYETLDDRCTRNLNGYHIAIDILKEISRIDEFGLALRAIKLWAKRRGIYQAKYGFLGGISWTIMLVYINQSYPKADAATLVQKFFETYHNWKWPKPVTIKQSIPVPKRTSELHNWNTSNELDSKQLMPVLTPTSPQRNCACNISPATLRILISEVNKGNIVTNNITSGLDEWISLFKVSAFFDGFQHFLVLKATAFKGVEKKFFALINARIHFLMKYLSELTHVERAQNFHEPFYSVLVKNQMIWIIGIEADEFDMKRIGLSSAILKFKEETKQKAKQINISSSDLDIKEVNKDNLKSNLPRDVYEKISL